MSRWSRFKQWMAGVAMKAASLSFLPVWVRHSVIQPTFDLLVREGLKANATVQACLFLLARTFPEPELWPWAHDGMEYRPLPNHPLRQLLRKPNGDMGEAELMAYSVVYASLGGNIYLWKQRSASGRVVGLWPFHDGQMQPVAGQNTAEGLVAYYMLDTGDGMSGNPFGVERLPGDALPGVPIPKQDVIQWKWMIDPQYPWRGMGALVAAAADVDMANELRNFVYSLLKNDATPPVVVTLMEGEEVTPAKTRRLREEWKQALGGANRGTPAFLEAGMTVQRMALTLNELKFDSLGESPEIAICQGFGIQPIMAGTLVGLKTSGVQANFEQARKMYAELTLIPLWRSFASEIEQGMMGEPGYDDTAVRFDLAQVRALQENQDALWARAVNAYDSNLITRAEGRSMVGLVATPADEVYKESLAIVLTPAGAAARPRAGEEGKRALPAGETKATSRAKLRQIVEERVRIRERVAGRAETAVERWFEELAEAVIARAAELDPAAGKGAGPGERKELRPEDWDAILSMLFGQDGGELTAVLRRYSLEVMQLSWPFWNLELDSTAAFDLNDPAVTNTLLQAGTYIRDMGQATRDALTEYLQEAYRDGAPIEEIAERVRGLIAETYKNRAQAVARTEIGRAQNMAGTERYKAAGVVHVEVFDNGFDNSHEFCRRVAGQVVTLGWSQRNPLQHPNCVRAFGARFDYEGEVFTDEVPWG